MAAGTIQLAGYVTSDGEFLKQILDFGAEHLKRCYQCGTCSVVCPLTPLEQPFPRKEMAWAQWGLKDRLLKDVDVWLCHQCNDCSAYCPTDARPGDLMAAARNYQITTYATPRFLAKAATQLKYLPLLFVYPLLLTFIVLLFAVLLPEGGYVLPEGDILFENFIPRLYIDATALGTMAIAFAIASVGMVRFWRNITQSRYGGVPPEDESFFRSLVATVGEILKHSDFKRCGVNASRYHAHGAIFYGALFLFFATTGAFLYTTVFLWIGVNVRGGELSLPIYDPVKVIGNVGGIALFAGLLWVTYRRLARRQEAGGSTYFDWLLIALLFLTTVTGFLLEALRYAQVAVVAYPLYLVHLVFVYASFIYAPFSKLAHLFYRTLAMTYARQIGRKARQQL
ncbi:MAG: quinone-interacting membrane-bound oxidoreductase complex subunit QmoC [Dehalococcoidia bacterium]